MSVLSQIADAVDAHGRFVEQQVARSRTDARFRKDLLRRWQKVCASIATVATPTGLKLPRLALPQTNEPGEIARCLSGEGLPGQFPFVNGAYPELYLEHDLAKDGAPRTSNLKSQISNLKSEEPTRLFAGLGLAEDTNQRFHYLAKQQ